MMNIDITSSTAAGPIVHKNRLLIGVLSGFQYRLSGTRCHKQFSSVILCLFLNPYFFVQSRFYWTLIRPAANDSVMIISISPIMAVQIQFNQTTKIKYKYLINLTRKEEKKYQPISIIISQNIAASTEDKLTSSSDMLFANVLNSIVWQLYFI